jgi:hypothetical protein
VSGVTADAADMKAPSPSTAKTRRRTRECMVVGKLPDYGD